jgi:hypothetical protein
VRDDEIAFGHDGSQLVSERRRKRFHQVEQAFTSRRNVRAMLDVRWRPEFLGSGVVALVEERVECFQDERFV